MNQPSKFEWGRSFKNSLWKLKNGVSTQCLLYATYSLKHQSLKSEVCFLASSIVLDNLNYASYLELVTAAYT